MCARALHQVFRRWRCDVAGATAVEYAFVAPMLLMVLIALIQLGWTLHCAASVRWALENSARSLMLDPNVSASDLRASMLTQLSGIADASSLTVTLATDSSDPTQTIKTAQSAYTQALTLPFLPSWNFSFHSSVAVPTS